MEISGQSINAEQGLACDIIKALKKSESTNGYELIHLYENGIRKTMQVHRIVAATFLGESSLCVNHKDMNKKNNHISNLEYVTYKENYWHARNLGVFHLPPRDPHKQRKLNKTQVFEILSAKIGCDKLGRIYKIQPSTIVKIRAGKAYCDWYKDFHSNL